MCFRGGRSGSSPYPGITTFPMSAGNVPLAVMLLMFALKKRTAVGMVNLAVKPPMVTTA